MNKLYYIADPMCSWCWAFSEILTKVRDHYKNSVEFQYVMGGLAPDSEELMDEETIDYIKSHWRTIEERTGADFNWDFWDLCKPRRSTYLACRAVIAAANQDSQDDMFYGIQYAYYQQARNPSDLLTLLQLAEGLGMERQQFAHDIQSPAVEAKLQAHFETRRELKIYSFPSLILETENGRFSLSEGYSDWQSIERNILTG
ncbi:MAG: DsbA family protein [Lentisphaeria bacterium]|nr:DsbA family protein [Lentisphaeria bacterium]NQZ68920.1 DsbA family protein [Lentisphaeria bacterium]